MTPSEETVADFRSKVQIAETTSATVATEVYVVLTKSEARELLVLLERLYAPT